VKEEAVANSNHRS